MKLFKKKLSRKNKKQIAVATAVILLIIVLICLDFSFDGPLYKLSGLLSDRARVERYIAEKGAWAPVVFMVLQFLQTVFAPIPGSIIGLVGGFLFGWWGILWTILGTAPGFILVLWLSRKLGRPFVEKIISKPVLDRFDFLAKRSGAMVFFVIFLIPGLPDDVVMYIAGLSKIPLRTLFVMAVIGRIPAVVGTNIIGLSAGVSNLTAFIVSTGFTIVILVIVALMKDKIFKWIRGEGDPAEVEKSH